MHAFVDESARAGLTVCAVVVAPNDAALVRSALRQLLGRGQQRLHMTKESGPRRRLILARLCEQPLRALIYESSYHVHREGRAEIMCRIVGSRDIDRLTIESDVGQDEHDVRAIQAEVHRLDRRNDLHYEHREPRHEPLLWAADAIVFALAAGGELRRRCEPLIASIETVSPHA